VVSRSGATIAAIEDVYRRAYPRFLRVARATLGDDDRARDAVQETFARAIRARADFRGDGSLEGWIWRTLVRVCTDDRRGRAPRATAPASTNGHPVDWPELRAAVAALPERQRLALFLRHYADLDYDAIAVALGVRRGTVAATLHAAHESLRRTLTEVTG
jgi:RNA polymerase sigma-70 factor (ECF subfamily)